MVYTSPPADSPSYQAMLLQHISDAVLAFDTHSVITFWNPATERLYGWKAEEVLGKALHDIVQPSFIGLTVEEAEQALRRDGHFTAEAIVHGRDGCAHRVEIRTMPLLSDSGELLGNVCLHRDITEAHAATEALRQERNRFQDLVETIHDWVWEVDSNGIYTYVSPRVFDLLGYTPEELLGRRPFDLMPPEEARRLYEFFRGAVSRGENFHGVENVNCHRSGRMVVLETNGRAFFADDGALLGYRGADRDITDRKNVEEALRASDRMKTEFVATTAHEFRTPLTAIQGYAELLLAREDLAVEEQREFLTYIYDSAQDLAEIVSDLLDIARLEEGQTLRLDRAPVSIREMVAKVASMLKTDGGAHQIEVALQAEETLVLIDRGRIGQVLENLLSNALKYSPAGTKVQILGERLSAEWYQVTVRDEGIGMSEEQVARVFEKFYRADASHSAVSGLGIGMSVVKHIVEAHGGEVAVESILGVGTSVRFTVPTSLKGFPAK